MNCGPVDLEPVFSLLNDKRWPVRHATLNDIGTSKSLSVLRSSLSSRKRDIKDSAASAIEAIEARETGMPT